LTYIIINSLNELEQYKKLTDLINDILNKKLPFVYEEFFLYKLAYAYLRKGSFYKAAHVMSYIILKDKTFKNNYRYAKFYGDFYWKKGKYTKAVKFYEKALRKKEFPMSEKFKISNKIANFFFKKRAYSPALKYYIRAYEIKENDEILLKTGEIYYYMGEYEKSIIILNRFLKKYPDYKETAHIYYKLGNSWIKKGNYDKGIFILKKYLKEHKKENNSENIFWIKQIENSVRYEEYKNKLKNLKEITIKKEGL